MIVATASSVILLSLSWWGACTFYIGPTLFSAYVESEGRLLAKEPKACEDVDSRALGTLSALLATLIALKKKE